MKLNDEILEEFRKLFSHYPDFKTFVEKRPSGINFDSIEDVEELFDAAKDDDFWYLTSYYISSDSLVIKANDKTTNDIEKEIEDNGPSNYKRIIVELDNKNYPGLDNLNKYHNILVRIKGMPGFCSVDEFLDMREFFNTFLETYPTEGMSELEKITLAYDHVKFFEYQWDEEDSHSLSSRNIAKVFSTSNIVCAGYTYMFCELLREMGIESAIMSVQEDDEDNEFNHVRPLVQVNDKKYNISGLYIFDPTWDSSQEMYLTETKDGKKYYDSELDDDVKVIKELPRSISYNFFLVPAREYKKYFPNEIIDTLEKYPTDEEVEYSEDINIDSLDTDNLKFSEIINILPEVLRTVKRIEGMPEEQIDEYIEDAMNIIIKYRFEIIRSAPKF